MTISESHRKLLYSILVPLAALAVIGVATVGAQELLEDEYDDHEEEHHERRHHARKGVHLEALSSVLDISVDELKEAREEGELKELIQAHELDREELKEELKAAHVEIATVRLAELVANGELTQEEADAKLERIKNGKHKHHKRGRGIHKAGHIDIASELLGLTEDELKAAKESGTSFEKLLEAAGLTKEEFRAQAKELHDQKLRERLAQKVADGELTQEEADERLEKRTDRRERMNDRRSDRFNR